MQRLLTLFVGFFLSGMALPQAPTLYNNALFYIDSAEIHVFGNIENSGASAQLIQDGYVQTYNDQNQGDFELNTDATVISTGNFKIENDWINSANLQIDTGVVEMYGDNQWFLGDSISKFWDLLLTGTDAKEQDQHIRVINTVDITNVELAVHDKLLFLDNPLVASIIYDNTFNLEGIISTDEDGQVRKVVNQNEENLIPLGSHEGGFFRHRPLKSTLQAGGTSDTLYATFHHHTPDFVNAFEIDMDTSLCKIQTAYFYTVNSADSSNVYDLDFAHLPPIDGFYPHPAQWDNPTWKVIYNNASSTSGNYSYAKAIGESDFVQEHYTLGYRTPKAPILIYDSTECYSDAHYYVEQPLGEPWYEWTVNNSDASAEIVQGVGTDHIQVDWNENIGGMVYVQYQDTAGCWSHLDSGFVIDVSIDAQFSYAEGNTNSFDTDYQFFNESSSNTEEIHWYMNAVDSSGWLTGNDMVMAYPYTYSSQIENDQFEVMLVAHDLDYGCYDTAYQVILVPNTFVFYAPNTFTPNGDEFNNTFFAHSSEIESAELRIFNRWGELIFFGHGNDLSQIVWDGTYQGQSVPQGSYIYQFEIIPINYNVDLQGPFIYTGHVNLVR